MYRMPYGMMLAAAASVGAWWTPADQLSSPVVQAVDSPPAPWAQGDPADSLYRAAREWLNRREFRRAAELFPSRPTRRTPSTGRRSRCTGSGGRPISRMR